MRCCAGPSVRSHSSVVVMAARGSATLVRVLCVWRGGEGGDGGVSYWGCGWGGGRGIEGGEVGGGVPH